jgi:hypothetical protein
MNPIRSNTMLAGFRPLPIHWVTSSWEPILVMGPVSIRRKVGSCEVATEGTIRFIRRISLVSRAQSRHRRKGPGGGAASGSPTSRILF